MKKGVCPPLISFPLYTVPNSVFDSDAKYAAWGNPINKSHRKAANLEKVPKPLRQFVTVKIPTGVLAEIAQSAHQRGISGTQSKKSGQVCHPHFCALDELETKLIFLPSIDAEYYFFSTFV